MLKRTIFIIVGIIVFGLAGYYWYWIHSPKYSLLQIKVSIEKHDIEGFYKYVDVESMVDRLIDQILENSAAGAKESRNEWEKAGQNIAKGLVSLLKPQLVKLAKEQVTSYVERGSFESQQSHTQDAGFSPAKMLEKPEVNKSKFSGIEYVKKDGKIAIVGIGIFYEIYDAKLILDIKMREKDGHWQVIEISNFLAYLKNLDSIKIKRLEQLNAPIIESMNKTLIINNISKKTSSDRLGIRNKVIMKFKLYNISSKDIVGFGVILLCNNSKGDILKTISVTGDGAYGLKAGTTISEISADFEINQFNEVEKLLFDTPAKLLSIGPEIQYIKFSDGSELRLNEKLPISDPVKRSVANTAPVASAEVPFQQTLEMAKKGDAAAQTKLGEMYKDGKGVKQDKQEAVKWFRKAAEQGHARAQNIFGLMYSNGEGVFQDKQEAVKWIRTAAEQGYAAAQYNLGWMYLQGDGVTQDKQEAVKWIRKAAEKGEEKAISVLTKLDREEK